MKKIQLVLSALILSIGMSSYGQSEVERALGSFSGVLLTQVDEAELIKGSSNKVVLTFTGAKEKQIISEVEAGTLSIGYKGDKKPEGATLKAKIYTSGSLDKLELSTGTSAKAKGLSWGSDLKVVVTGESTLDIDASASKVDVRVNSRSKITLKAKAETAFVGISTSSKATAEVEATTLEVKVSAKSRLDITGSSTTLKVTANNSGKYMGHGMTSKDLTVQAHSSGRAEVHASESIIVNVVSEGKVYYKGNPASTKFNGTSSGTIEKVE